MLSCICCRLLKKRGSTAVRKTNPNCQAVADCVPENVVHAGTPSLYCTPEFSPARPHYAPELRRHALTSCRNFTRRLRPQAMPSSPYPWRLRPRATPAFLQQGNVQEQSCPLLPPLPAQAQATPPCAHKMMNPANISLSPPHTPTRSP